jgi:hypothetical protein
MQKVERDVKGNYANLRGVQIRLRERPLTQFSLASHLKLNFNNSNPIFLNLKYAFWLLDDILPGVRFDDRTELITEVEHCQSAYGPVGDDAA